MEASLYYNTIYYFKVYAFIITTLVQLRKFSPFLFEKPVNLYLIEIINVMIESCMSVCMGLMSNV